ncbi:GNAT family N-acetyltransferase [Fusibacter sp. JL216-2]|uniref:GNAT family N-acetyltransferase n=1 Tax=Fusibacter sp. JL216-2 TaxID=3071453 RepID=UPI003D33456C
MIRKLDEYDKEQVLEYLGEEPAINLFFIGDIESFGFDKDFQEIWADFNIDGDIQAVFLRFYENFIPYSKISDYDWSAFKEMVIKTEKETEGHVMMSGKESIIEKFNDILPNHKRRSTFFCEITDKDKLVKEGLDDVKVANVNDAERIYNLIKQIEEFRTSVVEIDRIKQKIETQTGRVYYFDNEEEMTTVAQTTAENSMSAMVVGVATLKDHRNKGQMSRCLSKLCMDLLDEDKTLCLFYDNPKAGKVYHKLGFKTLEKWTMVSYDA